MSAIIEKEHIKKFLFLAVTAILLVLSFFIIKPYIIALVSAYILAFLVKPLYDKLSQRTSKSISALLCILVIFLVVVIPISAVVTGIVKQANTSASVEFAGAVSEKVSNLPLLDNLDLEIVKNKLSSTILSLITLTLLKIPSFIMSTLVMLLGIFFILVNWKSLSENLREYLPFKDKAKVSQEISETTRAIVQGYVLIAIIEFIVALTGFYISGVEYYLLLPTLIALFAFIPGLGPAVIWVPTAGYYLLAGSYLTAAGVIITGLIISILIETILFGRIMGKKTKINPLVFILGILGGIPMFGIFGFIAGPLILVYTIKLLEAALGEK